MDSAARRLGLASAASLSLHVALIAPWSWPHLDNSSEGTQVPIAATLRPRATETTAKPPPAERKPRVDRGKAKRSLLSIPDNPLRIPATKESETTAGSVEMPAAEESMPYVVQHAQPPEYPEAALRDGQEACVLAAVQVDVSGEVVTVKILASDLPGVFDLAVIESQKTARYAPARDKDGKPVASQVLAVAEFVILAERRLSCALKYAPQARQFIGTGTP